MKCLECGQEFESLKSLHGHLKAHDMIAANYYVKHYARKNMLTGELLQFKNYEDYFARDFDSYAEMARWLRGVDKETARAYALERLVKRKEEKGLEFAPCTNDLKLSKLPTVRMYEDLFKTYEAAAKLAGLKVRWGTTLPDLVPAPEDMEIMIDTREQQPLSFPKSVENKLDFGDYAVGGEHYTYTFVDRKSAADLKSTLTSGFERFVREIKRAREFGCFLYIVIEATIKQVHEETYQTKYPSSVYFAWANLKEIANEYADVCQFIFAGSREKSEELIPKLLVNGPRLWFTDVQHLLDKGEL